MQFEVSEEAAALEQATRALLRAEGTPDVVRDGWSGSSHRVSSLWRRLAAAGVIGTLVSEADGGLGLDDNGIAPLLQEIGRSGLPVPAVETICVAAPLLAAIGDSRLPHVLSGEVQVAAQIGTGSLVPFGSCADLVVLAGDGELRLFDRHELDLQPCATIDGALAMARVQSRLGSGVLLADSAAESRLAWHRGVVGTSAALVGLARQILEMTVGYVSVRQQFGVPVGSFQALKHALASARLAVDFAWPLVLSAGWALSADSADAVDLVSAAKVQAAAAALLVTRTAIQCHGAMGYTTEYDLHLYAKRVWALAPTFGDAVSHRAQLARSLGVPHD